MEGFQKARKTDRMERDLDTTKATANSSLPKGLLWCHNVFMEDN
jgi:hypothetical protein